MTSNAVMVAGDIVHEDLIKFLDMFLDMFLGKIECKIFKNEKESFLEVKKYITADRLLKKKQKHPNRSYPRITIKSLSKKIKDYDWGDRIVRYIDSRIKPTEEKIEEYKENSPCIDWDYFFNFGAEHDTMIRCTDNDTCSIQKLSVLNKRTVQGNTICKDCKVYDQEHLTNDQRLNYIATLPFKMIGSFPTNNISKGKIQMICNTCGYVNNMYWYDLYRRHQGCAKCNGRVKCTYENAIDILSTKHLTMLTEKEDFKHGKESYVDVKCNICGDIRTAKLTCIETSVYGCSACAGNKPLDSFDVYQQLLKRDINWLIDLDDYKGVDASYPFQCMKCQNEWTNILDKIKNSNQGCPKCAEKSKAESLFVAYMKLKYPDIIFIQQKKFSECRDKMCLPFDFYIPSLNLLVELDGEQHFPTRKGYHNESITRRDGIKTKFCKDRNINFVRVSYLAMNKIYLLHEIIDEILQKVSLVTTMTIFYITRYNVITKSREDTDHLETSDGTHLKYFETVKRSYQDNINIH